MDYIDILQEMLKYIDENLNEKLSVEKLAARAGFSPYHFSRVFQWGTGYSIMEYVRLRRLAFAAYELNSDRRIIDIAIEYGFETHSGFSKAFRRYFGCSPEKYRMHAVCKIPELPILKKTKQYLNGGIIMEPKLVNLKEITLAGFLLKTTVSNGENNREIPKFWQECIGEGKITKLHGESFIKNYAEYGACFPHDPETGRFEYVIGVEAKNGCDIPEPYYVCKIPEGLFAVFSTPPADESGFVAAIQGTWQFIYSEWFPSSGYEFAGNGVDFELYDERCMGETGKICDIYIPVSKKQK